MLKDVEVQFTPETEKKLDELAAQNGHETADQLVRDIVEGYLDEQDRFVKAVKTGEDALESGEYLTHEQVGERLRRFL